MPARSCVLLILLVAIAGLSAGCLTDAKDAMSAGEESDTNTNSIRVSTDLMPDSTSDAADGLTISGSSSDDTKDVAPASSLATADLAALLELLDGISAGDADNLLGGAADGSLTPGGLDELGFSRREMALLALDFVAIQADLSSEQEFALSLVRAVISGDREALAQLLLERLLSPLMQASGNESAEVSE
jgi:hypothetical protein